MAETKTLIEVPDFVTVRELADIMETSPIDVIKQLMNNGIMANINQQIDFDTVTIIGEEMGYEIVLPTIEEPETIEEEKEMTFLGNILTNDDINAIAAYINDTTPPTDGGDTTPPPDGGTTEPNGETLYNTYCASCHGAKGSYEFRREVAGEDAGDISSAINEVSSMASLANALTQADIEAIAAYINDQAPNTGGGHTDGDHHSRGGSDDSSDDDEKPSDMSKSNPFANEKLGTGSMHWLVLGLAAVIFYRRRRISKV